MLAREFAYWLNGYFEIGGAGKLLPMLTAAEQIDCILRHAKLVRACDWDNPSTDAHHLVVWVEGHLAGGLVNCDAMRERLAGLFKHEIDKDYDVDQDEAQTIHDGVTPMPSHMIRPPGSGAGGTIFRC